MFDNQLSALIVTALGSLGNVVQNPQPTTQGHATAQTIYFQHLFDYRVGRPKVEMIWNDAEGLFDETETIFVESTYQISAVAPTVIDGATENTKTSFDTINMACSMLQSSKFVRELAEKGAGIQRVGRIANPYFEDDNKRNTPMPSFDIVFSHQRKLVNGVPEIKSVEVDLKRV